MGGGWNCLSMISRGRTGIASIEPSQSELLRHLHSCKSAFSRNGLSSVTYLSLSLLAHFMTFYFLETHPIHILHSSTL